MSRASAGRLVWALWALIVALVVGELVFSILNRDTEVESSSGPLLGAVFVVVFLTFPTFGALVASRRPRNPIGWILLGAGVAFGVTGFAEGYGVYALYTDPDSLAGGVNMAWLSAWVFIPALFAAPALLFLLFPDGRLPSPRWRPVVWLAVIAPAVAAADASISPGRLEDPPFADVVNPYGLEGADWLVVFSTFGWVGGAAAVAGAAICMILRLRRARGVERQQLKWIATAAALFALACLVAVPTYYAGQDEFGAAVILLALLAIPIATGLAILRYRLYDIDVVINRTLVYGSVTALLAGAYLGLVLLFQLAFSPLTEENSLAVALSTLAVAALFRPARNRVQAVVDRRFYRRKYDTAQTLTLFAARLRDEVDLDALRAELTGVVGETMQPAHVSLWLRAGALSVTPSVTIPRRSSSTKEMR
jgi:3',5'-cyclic AMP phosphodiesterase CpdA